MISRRLVTLLVISGAWILGSCQDTPQAASTAANSEATTMTM